MNTIKTLITTLFISGILLTSPAHALLTEEVNVTRIITIGDGDRILFQTDLPVENPANCLSTDWYELALSSNPKGNTMDLLITSKVQNFSVEVFVNETRCSIGVTNGYPQVPGIIIN